MYITVSLSYRIKFDKSFMGILFYYKLVLVINLRQYIYVYPFLLTRLLYLF